MKIGLIAIEADRFLQRLNFRRKAHFYGRHIGELLFEPLDALVKLRCVHPLVQHTRALIDGP